MGLRKIEDGLTKSEIEGAIRDTKSVITKERHDELAARDRALDAKLEKHKEEINDTLNRRLAPLEAMRDDLILLVGTDKQTGQVGRLLEMGQETNDIAKANGDSQRALVERHDRWHEEDETYRAQTKEAIGVVKEEAQDRHNDMMQQLYYMAWIVSTAKLVVAVGTGVLKTVAKGRDVWTVVAALLTAWIAAMQYIHANCPRAYIWTVDHHNLMLLFGGVILVFAVISTMIGKNPKAENKRDDKSDNEP